MKIPALIAFLMISTTANLSFALDISGVIVNGEAGFDYNLLSSKDKNIPFTSGANEQTYRLNTAQAVIKKDTEQFSLLGRLAYSQTQYSPDGTTKNVANFGTLDQLELFYRPNNTLYLGFGRFLTTMGFESLMKSENYFYNNTIAYQGIVPGYGEGLRARWVPVESFTATISTYNQATYGAFGDDYTPTKATEASLTGFTGNFTWFAGYLFGKDGAAPADRTEKTATSVWAQYKFMENGLVALTYDSRTHNTNEQGTKWSDSASIVLTYPILINNLGLRYEHVRGAGELVDLSSGLNYGSADQINSWTATDRIVLTENLNLYVEYRFDQADAECFFDGNGNPSKIASLFTLGALAHF